MKFLSVKAIESSLVALNKAYPQLTQLYVLPNNTHEGRTSNALLIRGNPGFTCRPALVFISGVHAREWGGPDILVNLAADLLEAYTTNAGLQYGGKTFSASDVRTIVNRTDIVVFPDVNPDGRAYSMAAAAGTPQAMWRKNRNPASSGGDPKKIGVDINRNYDFLWDFPVKFAPGANPGTLASNDPASDLFHGTAAFSEPESRNVRWLVDQFANARYFVDVHSYTGDVLYSWGDDENQTTDPGKSFTNPAWDGKRGLAGDAYGEYIPAARQTQIKAAATALRDGINAVRSQGYVTAQAFWLFGTTYPTSGASEDWAFSREFLTPSRGKLAGLCIEFNKRQDFFPTWPEMVDHIKDVDAGLLALAAHARPGWLTVIFCRFFPWWREIRIKIYAIWKRLFPPDLWGPYGPWTRVVRLAERIADRIVGVIRRRGQ